MPPQGLALRQSISEWLRQTRHIQPQHASFYAKASHPAHSTNKCMVPLVNVDVNYVTLRKIERFRRRDTPLRSLYRLYESVVADNEDEMMQESQYWFHRQTDWLLAVIPDPQDLDPVRYAILASLTDALVLSFNHKIKYGMRRGITNKQPLRITEFHNDPDPPLETSPAWCEKVGALSQRLTLVPGTSIPSDLTILTGPLTPDNLWPFGKRNITANFVQLYNI